MLKTYPPGTHLYFGTRLDHYKFGGLYGVDSQLYKAIIQGPPGNYKGGTHEDCLFGYWVREIGLNVTDLHLSSGMLLYTLDPSLEFIRRAYNSSMDTLIMVHSRAFKQVDDMIRAWVEARAHLLGRVKSSTS